MPPQSSTERQKLLLQQEIAKLSGAISRHATNPAPNAYHPYRGRGVNSSSSRGGYSSYGSYSSRGRGRGSARGGRGGRGGYSLDLRGARTGASGTGIAAGTPKGEKEEGEVSPPPEASDAGAAADAAGSTPYNEWIKKTSRGGNMSLMTVQKRNQLAARPPPQRKPKVPAHIEVLESETSAGGEGKRVVIDGVIFQFEQGGGKLVRIGELAGAGSGNASGSGAAGAPLNTPTRQSLRYGGEKYTRTKRGNLIARSSLSQRRAEQANKPCRYFTKTGRCDRALTCPYKHAADRIAICPRFLRGACPLGAGACPLSHAPSPHNTPSCVYFQATATCRNGDSCVYPHVRVAADAPVCEAFAREGWCDREAGTCPELHIWECPEWHSKGTCARGAARCGLRHVLRREKAAPGDSGAGPAAAPAAQQAQGGFDDQSEFIGLPAEVFSDTSDSEEDGGDDDGEEDTDEEEDEEENKEEGEEEDEESEEEDTDSDAEGKRNEAMDVEDTDTGKLPPSSDIDDDEARVLADL